MNYQVYRCAWCTKHLLEEGSTRQPRSDRKFCSNSCRGKYNRWLKNLEKYEARATGAIKAIAEYIQHPIAQASASGALARMNELIRVEAQANGLREVE